MEVAGLPSLDWVNDPGEAEVHDGVLRITAGARTDWVADPTSGDRFMSAPALAFPAPEICTLSARVQPTFSGTFDAGVLMIYQDERTWGKLCFEFSPQREPMVVSVITRDLSDDCNSVVVQQNWVYVRIARLGGAFAYHYSLDGAYWHFVRLFALGDPGAHIRIGFLAQSPMGSGASASFSEIQYGLTPLKELRDGS
jgi:uncharacterized protein